MKKKIIKRGLFGFPIGIAIGHVITLIISIIIGGGSFYPVQPDLIRTMGTELNAVLFQTILCGIMGTVFSMSSAIWEIEEWSIAKQTAVYFGISCIIMFPIAYATNWMQHSIKGIIAYMGFFTIIFFTIWLVQYSIYKRNIDRINESLKCNDNL